MSRKMEQGMDHLRMAIAAALPTVVEFPRGIFVTVLDSKMTRDEKHASVTISVLPGDRTEDALATLREFSKEIKHEIARTLRLRRIPNLFWKVDTTEEYASHIEQTINELERKGEL
ncbi:MAG: ribosome-binding factor A [Patescibacteria group bacterium]